MCRLAFRISAELGFPSIAAWQISGSDPPKKKTKKFWYALDMPNPAGIIGIVRLLSRTVPRDSRLWRAPFALVCPDSTP